MRKAVEEYLEGRGCRVMRPPAEPAPPTLESLVDGFLVHVLRLDPESYRRAFWHEAYKNGHTLGHVPRTFGAFFRRNARTFEQKVSLLLALAALFGVRLSLLVKRLRRPTYYERERERRRKLAEARREIRRHHTLNPKPTFDAIRAALRVAHGSPEDAIRLGSLLEDLECFVDNTLIHDVQGQIVGRRGGIKRATLLPAPEAASPDSATQPARTGQTPTVVTGTAGTSPVPAPAQEPPPLPAGAAEGLQEDLARARSAAREILAECEGTLISLEAALALRLDPDCIPANGEQYVQKPGRPRIPRKVIGWLVRRRVA